MVKVKLRLEHATGKAETVTMSLPVALAILPRLLQPGWPFLDVSVLSWNDGNANRVFDPPKRLKSQHDDSSNAFETIEGEVIVL